MKTSLTILSAALLLPLVIHACGAEAPAPLSSNSGVTGNDPSGQSTTTNGGPITGATLPTPTNTGTMNPPVSDTNMPGVTSDPAGTPAGTQSDGLPRPTPPMTGTPTPTSTDMPATPTMTATMMPTMMPTMTATTTDPVIPMAGGNTLIPDAEGWIDGSTNSVGVQGGWYSFDDTFTTGHAVMYNGGEVCMSGQTATQVDAGMQWGAGMGLVLNDGGADVQNPWDGSAYTGFSFTATVTSDNAGTPLAIELKMGTVDPPHQMALTAGSVTVNWTSVAQPTWATTMTPFSAAQLTAIQFKVGTSTTGPTNFSVCISNLTVI